MASFASLREMVRNFEIVTSHEAGSRKGAKVAKQSRKEESIAFAIEDEVIDQTDLVGVFDGDGDY